MSTSERSLGESVHFGVKWLGLAMGCSQLVRLGTTAVLARLLLREHFGLVALATTGIYAISAFREMGFSQALIRRRVESLEEEHLAADTAFWILQATNVLLFVIGWTFAPQIARFFDRIEGVEPVLRAMLVLFLVEGLSSVSAALLQKRMDFDGLAKNEMRGTAMYALVALTLALLDFEAWSIVWAQILSRLYMIGGLLRLSGWRPRLRIDRGIAAELFRFGRWLWVTSLLQAGVRSADKLLLGKLSDAATLGTYSVAQNLCTAPAKPANSILVRVALPALSSIQDDRPALGRAFSRGLALASILALPATFGLILVADDLVVTVYGERWRDMAILVRILPLYAFALVLGAISGPLLLATGRSRAVMVIQTGRQFAFFALLPLLASSGAPGIAWAVALPALASLFVGLVWAARCCDIGWRTWLMPQFRILLSSLVMAAAVLLVRASMPLDLFPPLRLTAAVLVGVASFLAAARVVDRSGLEALIASFRRILGSRGKRAAPAD